MPSGQAAESSAPESRTTLSRRVSAYLRASRDRMRSHRDGMAVRTASHTSKIQLQYPKYLPEYPSTLYCLYRTRVKEEPAAWRFSHP